MVSALIAVAAIAWLAQLALGGWQIRQFNRAFDRLCQQGRVGVGVHRAASNRARSSPSPLTTTIASAIRC